MDAAVLVYLLSDCQDTGSIVRKLSAVASIVSGVIQGFCCGPGLHVELANTLLRRVKTPAPAFVELLKIVANINKYNHAEV